MTSAILATLLKSLAPLGLFLIIGALLRAKLTIFQKTFIPASVIGGFLLLLLGPQVLNILPFPEDWYSIYSLIPGVIIVPIVAAVPLGLRLGGGGNGQSSDFIKNVIPLAALGVGVSVLQFASGYIVAALWPGELYETFGVEVGIGFVGGHGTAGTLGSMLSEMGVGYWETAQGVATTTATFGIVGGILTGIAMINWAARRGQTALLTKPADIPHNLRVGYEADITKQGSCGRETTLSSSVDTFAFHAALVFLASGIAYWLNSFFGKTDIPVLSSTSIWAYAMVVMFVIWGIICKLKLDFLVDAKVKSKLSSSLTEFAVIAAIASLPIKAVATYIVPIILMVVLGFVVTVVPLFFFCKRFIKGYWVEQMIALFGQSTGVFLTGVLLLRVCDPELESPALANYTLAYTIISIIYFALLNTFITLPLSIGAFASFGVATALGVVCIVAGAIVSRISFGKDFKGN